MGKRYVFFGPSGVGGGLNVSDNPIIVPGKQMVIADNILIGTTLARRKRGGRVAWGTSSYASTPNYPQPGYPIRGLLEYWRYASTTNEPTSDLFLHQNGKVWSIKDRASPGIDRTGALPLGATGVPCYRVFDGFLYFTSTEVSDGYNKWDGEAATAVAATPPPDGVGKCIGLYQGRMIMGAVPASPFTVYFSAPFDAENWLTNGATSQDLDYDGDPEGITAIFPEFQDGALYVATRRSIYKFTPDSSGIGFDRTVVSRGIGCIGQGSVVAVPNDIIFASDRGVHSLRQVIITANTEVKFLSRDIQLLWTTQLNFTIPERFVVSYDETINCVIFSVPSAGQTTNDTLLVYNIEYGTWTVWPSMAARSLAPVLISNKINTLLGQENGQLNLVNQANRNDLGVGYTARFRTGMIYPDGDFSREHRFKSITVLASTQTSGTFSVSWAIVGRDVTSSGSKSVTLSAGEDRLGSTFILGQSRLGRGNFVPKTISCDGIGYGIQIDIAITGTTDLEFYGFIIEAEDVNGNFN